MKKLLVLIAIGISLNGFGQDTTKSVVIVKPEQLKIVNKAGLQLEQAGKMKNWSLLTGAASILFFTLDAKADEKTGSIYGISGWICGLGTLTLNITSNAQIAHAGKNLRKLD